MATSNDLMTAVRRYVDGFNNGDTKAMAAACADPMQILDGMPTSRVIAATSWFR